MTQSNNPQDYVFQYMDGEQKKVKPYDLYRAMHGGDARPVPEVVFDGENLILSGVDKDGKGKTFAFPARSGWPDYDGSFDYSPEYQMEKNAGPIPEGKYWINSEEQKNNTWWEQFKNRRGRGHFPGGEEAWGEAKMPIHQSAEQKARTNREGMYIHGGKEFGSLGCIDLKDKETEFFKRLKELTPEIKEKEDKQKGVEIPLTVKYKKPKIEK